MVRRAAAWWPALALAVASLLAVAAATHPDPFPGEVGLVRQLQRLRQPVPDLAEFVRLTTGTTAAVIAGIPLAAWLAWRFRLAALPVVALALLAMYAMQPAIKELVDRPRPTSEDVEVRASWTSESFPSGHSLSTTTVWGFAAGLAWRMRRRAIAILLSLPIVLTLFSSSIQGVHWPSDAIAGTLFGAVAAWAMLRALELGRSRWPSVESGA